MVRSFWWAQSFTSRVLCGNLNLTGSAPDAMALERWRAGPKPGCRTYANLGLVGTARKLTFSLPSANKS